VFNSIKDDISILPVEVIHQVVAYYRCAERSNLLTEDLRTDDFKAQPEPRREAFVIGLMGEVEKQSDAAIEALDAILRYARLNLPWKITKLLLAQRKNFNAAQKAMQEEMGGSVHDVQSD
jgi:hypothetical protein